MTVLAKIDKSNLPRTYIAARAALAECVEIDECADWADKAKALAVYAAQSKDESLSHMALRIRARAIRRCGELIADVPPQQGGNRGNSATGPRRPNAETRTDVASAAGLSDKERKTALRVAAVPECEFEQAVESDAPPTIQKLAAMGTKKRSIPKRTEREAELFALATEGQAALGVLHRLTKKIEARDVAAGSGKSERRQMIVESKDCCRWLAKLIKEAGRV